MAELEDKTVVLVDGQNGIYVPQMFGYHYRLDQRWVGCKEVEIGILTVGPDHPLYWDAWEHVLDQAKYIDKDGREFSLWQDGDLFAYTGDGEQWV